MRVYIAACFLLFTITISTSVFSQKITGRVLNEGGKGASHVTVRFTNKSNSVTTNVDGGFTIIARKLPDTLVFSAAGYEPYRVVVSEETVKDTDFEVVLLSTRSKATMAEAVGEPRLASEEKRYPV